MKGLLFTYLLTYGGSLVALFNPFYGLLVYVCFAIVKPDAMWFFSVPQGNYSRLVALALLLGWAGKGFGRWNFGRAKGIVAALVFFWVWSTLSAVLAPNQKVAWEFVESFSKIALPFLVGLTLIHSVRQLKQLAWVLVLSQGYVALEFNLSYLGGYNRLWLEGFGGMDNNCNGIALVTMVGTAFFLALYTRNLLAKGVGLAAMALMVHAILFSFSRGALLSLIISGFTAFLFLPKKPVNLLIFAILVILGARLAGQQVLARFETTFASEEQRDGSAASRVQLWGVCGDLMMKNPLGIGPNHFPLVVHEFGFERNKEAHTLWLQLGAELGFPGVCSLLLFFGMSIVQLGLFLWRQPPGLDPWYFYFSQMVIVSILGFCISAQFVSLKMLETPYYVVLLGAGVLKLTSATRKTSAWRPQQPSPQFSRISSWRTAPRFPVPGRTRAPALGIHP